MKIERIDENKIKVLINNIEAREWNITQKKITQNSPEAQQIFRRAILMAKESVDFSIEGARLFIETLPLYTEGIGMLITKVNNDIELREAINNCSYKGKIRRGELRPTSVAAVKRRKYIYKFDSFDSLCAAAYRLKNKFSGQSVLYKMEEKYYLYLLPATAIEVSETEIALCEFADLVPNGQYIHGKLNEYGTVMIAEDAVNIINEYF